MTKEILLRTPQGALGGLDRQHLCSPTAAPENSLTVHKEAKNTS